MRMPTSDAGTWPQTAAEARCIELDGGREQAPQPRAPASNTAPRTDQSEYPG